MRVIVDMGTGSYIIADDETVIMDLTPDQLDDFDDMSDAERVAFASRLDASALVGEAQKLNPRV